MSLFMRTNQELSDGRVVCTTYQTDGSVTLAITYAGEVLSWLSVDREAHRADPDCLDFYRDGLIRNHPRPKRSL